MLQVLVKNAAGIVFYSGWKQPQKSMTAARLGGENALQGT
jgi:hypothetical protein